MARTTDIVTDGVNGTPRIGKETRPKTIVLTPIMKVVDVVINPSLMLSDNFVRGLNAKLDLVRYEADFSAGAPFAPSVKAVNLSLASGTNHIAPADGYFTGYVVSGAAQQGIWVHNISTGLYVSQYSVMANAHLSFVMPMTKGQTMYISYGTNGAGGYLKFVYANWANRS